MSLTCEKLMEFNLLEEREKQINTDMDTELLIKMFNLFNW